VSQQQYSKPEHNTLETIFRTYLKIPFRLNVRYKRILSITSHTYVLIHGLADTGEIWKPILDKLPKDSNYIVVDLLGHGKSRLSTARAYSANYQARNVITTCLSLGLVGGYTFIGHSFGSVVSIECAMLIPGVKQLVLCALPLYKKLDYTADTFKINEPESVLFRIYNEVTKHPKSVITTYKLINDLGLVGPSHVGVNEKTFPAFVETLKSGIINQKSTKHLSGLSIPITIIYGRLDPFVIGKNIDEIAKNKPNIHVRPIISDHALRRPMINAILSATQKHGY
jgi:pimeloyl-ACP methyl ester carboxylesterase